jgi:hypothetical protein
MSTSSPKDVTVHLSVSSEGRPPTTCVRPQGETGPLRAFLVQVGDTKPDNWAPMQAAKPEMAAAAAAAHRIDARITEGERRVLVHVAADEPDNRFPSGAPRQCISYTLDNSPAPAARATLPALPHLETPTGSFAPGHDRQRARADSQGTYIVRPGGSLLFRTTSGLPFAALRSHTPAGPEFVSCSPSGNIIHYHHGLTERDARWLGIHGMADGERRQLANTWNEHVRRAIAGAV